jgi:23S rRNA-/tRNA-specific pseudouridylate synthase
VDRAGRQHRRVCGGVAKGALIEVIHEDTDPLAVNKPAGLLVHRNKIDNLRRTLGTCQRISRKAENLICLA